MIYFVTHLKDSIANNYLGIKFEPGVIEPFLKELKEVIGEDDYKIYTDNQQRRDLGQFNMNIIEVEEYNKLSDEMGIDQFINSLDLILKYEIDDLKMMGVGTATKNENRSYFIVCKSDKIDAIRKRYELKEKDLHITIGFKWKDVHGVSKNQVLEKEDKFLQLLKNEFYKNDNWDFIKKIGNFKLNPNDEIIPVKIEDTKALYKSGKYYISIGLLDDERFWIMCEYPIEEELPRLSQTEIAKILNKNKKV